MAKPLIGIEPCATAATRLVALLATWLAVVGCSSDDAGPTTYPVTGKVAQNGGPVAGATVNYHPEGEGIPAQALTDADGAYSVITYYDLGKGEKPGMAPGKYRVTISKLDVDSIKSTGQPPKNLLPEKYDSVETSELEAVVSAEGPNEHEFVLEE